LAETCKFGQGAYFALTAKNSSEEKYARSNDQKEQIILYCSLLVGRTLKGTREMRDPNASKHARKKKKSNDGGEKSDEAEECAEAAAQPDHYDTAVNDVADPTIFVAFKDAQAYPEYIIVFKDRKRK
jgi:poly [ADP-ribose] polymerase 10/14/15